MSEERIIIIDITAYDYIIRCFRIPGFVFPCTCPIGCIVEDRPQCEMNKLTRNNCKMCRYTKCTSAGMVMKWVISAYTPRVEKQRSLKKTNASSNSTEVFPTAKNSKYHEKNNSSLDETISNMKQIHDQALVIDIKVMKYI